MRFTRINVHNVRDLVPPWAIDHFSLSRQLESMFASGPGALLMPRGPSIYRPLRFWVEVDATRDPSTIRVCTPEGTADLSGHLVVTCSSPLHVTAQLQLPLNPIFKGYTEIQGTYAVYGHVLQTDVPLAYVGMTRQRWYERYAQHITESRAGSPYLFHRALRDHQACAVMHRVFFCELDHEAALEYEETLVSLVGLYPLGLNMIPGGKAGFAYLARLGTFTRTSEERDAATERLSASETLQGRPNPLCAARWAADPEYVKRVVCGHSGRLTVEQVRMIRIGASVGRSTADLLRESSARNERQIRDLVAGRTYCRIPGA